MNLFGWRIFGNSNENVIRKQISEVQSKYADLGSLSINQRIFQQNEMYRIHQQKNKDAFDAFIKYWISVNGSLSEEYETSVRNNGYRFVLSFTSIDKKKEFKEEISKRFPKFSVDLNTTTYDLMCNSHKVVVFIPFEDPEPMSTLVILACLTFLLILCVFGLLATLNPEKYDYAQPIVQLCQNTISYLQSSMVFVHNIDVTPK